MERAPITARSGRGVNPVVTRCIVRPMDFGIMTAKVDEIGYIARAENLGYSYAWVTDSPMIRSNC